MSLLSAAGVRTSVSVSVGGAGAEGKEHDRAKRYARVFRGDLAGSLRAVGEEAVSLLSAAGARTSASASVGGSGMHERVCSTQV